MEEADPVTLAEHIDQQAKNLSIFTRVEQAPSDTIFILVIGMTGSSKSTFISECTGKDAIVGHTLRSY